MVVVVAGADAAAPAAAAAAAADECKAADGGLLCIEFRHAAAEVLLRLGATTLEALFTPKALLRADDSVDVDECACACMLAVVEWALVEAATPRTPWLIMTVFATSMGNDTAMLPTVASTDASMYAVASSVIPRDATSHV